MRKMIQAAALPSAIDPDSYAEGGDYVEQGDPNGAGVLEDGDNERRAA